MHRLPTLRCYFFLGSALTALAASATAHAEAVSITPLGWDFGEVLVRNSANTTIQMESVVTTPLQIFSVSIADDPQGAFAVAGTDPDPIPSYLLQNEFVDAFVTFTPPLAGTFGGVFLLHSNDHAREYIEIPITGRGIVPESGSMILSLLGLAGMAYLCRRRRGASRGTWCAALLVCLALPAMAEAEDLEIIPADWDFGNVTLGQFADVTIRGESIDDSNPIILFDINFPPSDSDFSVESVFASNGADPPVPNVLLPGEYVDVVVRFAPLMLGSQSIDVKFISNDHNDSEITFPLTGRGVPEPASVALVIGGLSVLVACSRRRSFGQLLRVCTVLLLCLALPAMARAEAVSVTPLEWGFGEIKVGESASKTFIIASIDEFTPLTIGEITVVDDLLAAFAITAMDPIPPELYFEDEPISVTVTFAPPSVGPFAGKLSVETNDIHFFPPDGLVLRPLAGTGIPIPEPATAALLLVGLAGIASCPRHRAKPTTQWGASRPVAARPSTLTG